MTTKSKIALIAIVIIGYFIYIGGKYGSDLPTSKSVNQQVIDDVVQQYDIAKRQGDKVQIVVQAGLVAAAYLQAHDEENYRKWKDIEKQAKVDAGMNY